MRHIQLAIPTALQSDVCAVLEADGVDYAIVDDVSKEDSVLISFPLPVGAVEDVLERLRETGLTEDQFTVILNAPTATTADMASLEKRYKRGLSLTGHVSPPELRVSARRLQPDLATFVILITMGTVVAVVGLLDDSALLLAAAVVIASYGAIPIASGVGAVLDDREMFLQSIRYQGIGIGVALVVAIASAFAFQSLLFVAPELDITVLRHIDNNSRIGSFALSVGIFAGVIGVLALATDRPTIISGLAISVALIPAAATVGIAIVWTEYSIALSSFIVLLTSLVLINVTGFLTLVALGYDPSLVRSLRPDVGTTAKRSVYGVAFVGLALMVAMSGIYVYQNIQFEQCVTDSVNVVLEREPYEPLRLVDLNIDDTGGLFDTGSAGVTVTATGPIYHPYPDLSREIRRQISQNVGRNVTVRVHIRRYQVTHQTAGANERRNQAGSSDQVQSSRTRCSSVNRPVETPSFERISSSVNERRRDRLR